MFSRSQEEREGKLPSPGRPGWRASQSLGPVSDASDWRYVDITGMTFLGLSFAFVPNQIRGKEAHLIAPTRNKTLNA